MIVQNGKRPDMSILPTYISVEIEYLMLLCWYQDASKRPTFDAVLNKLRIERRVVIEQQLLTLNQTYDHDGPDVKVSFIFDIPDGFMGSIECGSDDEKIILTMRKRINNFSVQTDLLTMDTENQFVYFLKENERFLRVAGKPLKRIEEYIAGQHEDMYLAEEIVLDD